MNVASFTSSSLHGQDLGLLSATSWLHMSAVAATCDNTVEY